MGNSILWWVEPTNKNQSFKCHLVLMGPTAGHRQTCEGRVRRLSLRRKFKGRVMKVHAPPGAGGAGSQSNIAWPTQDRVQNWETGKFSFFASNYGNNFSYLVCLPFIKRRNFELRETLATPNSRQPHCIHKESNIQMCSLSYSVAR